MTEFVHVAVIDKFIQGFVDFMFDAFTDFGSRHTVLVVGQDARYPLSPANNVEVLLGRRRYLRMWNTMRAARKVFLHGLFDPAVPRLLAAQPWLLGKCHWLIWGGDLYDPDPVPEGLPGKVDRWAKRLAIHNVGHLVTHLPGDVDYARDKFGAKGRFQRCLLYPSNVFTQVTSSGPAEGTLRILVGNSGAATNNHLEVFERLAALLGDRDAKIIVPLSYGDEAYARAVESAGRKLFGERLVALTGFMSLQQYLDLLSTIDIAVFNHRRQQAVGNIVHLLGFGKKVYLQPAVSTWAMLTALGIEVFDTRSIELTRLHPAVAEANARRIKQNFSLEALRAQWQLLLDDEPDVAKRQS